MRFSYSLVGLVLVMGCSASGDPAAPSTADENSNQGTGGSDLIIPEENVNDEDCDNVLPVVYRDFRADHPDFEMAFSGDVVRRGLVQAELGGDKKPVFADSVGCPWDESTPLGCSNWSVEQPEITSAETFDQWYRDVPDVNQTFQKELTLTETAEGSGTFVFESSAFFPLQVNEGWGETPDTHLDKNFLFTTEIHLQFEYVAGQQFSFFGDDDLWIFVNDELALDLGGMHAEAAGTIDFDAQAAELGIVPGSSYSMDIFHAERHTTGSNFRIETNISCFVAVPIY